jgi:hypothetical protein
VYLSKVALVNYQYLEVVKDFLYGEYQLKTLEVRKLTEELIGLRNRQLAAATEGQREEIGRGVKDLSEETKRLRAQVKGQNASLLRMNQQLLVGSKGRGR